MSSRPITVLKLGGSVLRSEADLPRAVHEIYRWLRRGERVLAVVSALEGATDALFARGARAGEGASPRHLAALVATGEATSAALLGLAAERAGVPTEVLDARRAGLRAEGPPLDARPIALDRAELERTFERAPLAVLPGYVGCDAAGAPALLGRGGSDLSALFLARELAAARCILLKDVDGLFDRDPRGGATARRYATIRWEDALALGGEILQQKAARFAADERVPFEVRGLASARGTRVGAEATRFAPTPSSRTPLRVGLLGLGTVGLGVLRALRAEPERFDVVAALARRRRAELGALRLATRVDELLDAGCDAIVEAIGGIEPALGWVERALERGIDVATANKALIAEHGRELGALAREQGARLLYSASVGGALPAIETVRRLARRDRVVSIDGVLNGTTSFVLDSVAEGHTLDAAVGRAIELGFAEADPALDLDGTDAAHKLAILAREAGGADVRCAWVERRGIGELDPLDVRAAARRGERVRLVAACSLEGTEARLSVAPRALGAEHPLFATEGAGNALLVGLEDGARELFMGRGAGRWPATEAVLADLGDLARLEAVLGARPELVA